MGAAELQYIERDVYEECLAGTCPNILGNKYIPYHPHAKQAFALGMHQWHGWKKGDPAFHFMYGGAAGGGKSDMLLMAAAQYVDYPHFHAMMLRSTMSELMEPGALFDRAREWWGDKARLTTQHNKPIFVFPSGAKVSFGYMQNPDHHLRYKGGEYHLVCIDEVTAWKDPYQPDYVGFSRNRGKANDPIPNRYIVTANPDGPGYAWVRDRFVGKFDLNGVLIEPGKYPYLPATIHDNPGIDAEAYAATLSHLHPVIAQQLMLGDWRVRMPGDYFQRQWFGALVELDDVNKSTEWQWVRWWDLAASVKPEACYTAGVLMGQFVRGVRVVAHVARFRAVPGDRDERIIRQAHIDGRKVTVGIEIEPGSGGPAQFENIARVLKAQGFRVVGKKPGSQQSRYASNLNERDKDTLVFNPISQRGKEGRADPVAACTYRGYQKRGEGQDGGVEWYGQERGKGLLEQTDGIRLVAGEWVRDYLDELEGFPDGAYMDQVDATSGAWKWLEDHSMAGRMPTALPKRDEVQIDNYRLPAVPERDTGKDRAGHWMP